MRMDFFPTIAKLRTTLHPQNDIDLLLAKSINKDTVFLHTHPDYKLSVVQYFTFLRLVRQYRQGFSVAAITEHKEFFGLNFIVNKHTLIPRPETEHLVERALANLTPNTILIDVGTGTGCIPITLLVKSQATPKTTLAIDISRSALAVAKKNTKLHKVTITFRHGNLLTALTKKDTEQITKTDGPILITANLPYLTNEQLQNEKSIQREPKIALVADKQGLALYEALFAQVVNLKISQPLQLILEIDPSQTTGIQTLAKHHFPHSQIAIQKDLASRDRIVSITINSK
jgi:release factor glutamine methyltransferase